MSSEIAKKCVAELIGTFWLTLGGCGTAVIAASFPQVGVGLLGVAFAFGLTVLTMAYAIGHISGCHLNPAVTIGLTAGRRFPSNLIVPYIVAQVVGAIFAAAILYLIASGAPGFDAAKGFAANGYGAHSPGQYSLLSALVTEVVLTMMFLFVIMGATHGKAPAGFAPIAIGLCLTLIHLVSIPVTNTSVNPARSTGPALFVGGWARPALAVLDRSNPRRRCWRRVVPLAQRRARSAGDGHHDLISRRDFARATRPFLGFLRRVPITCQHRSRRAI
jgi:aquaporin Z